MPLRINAMNMEIKVVIKKRAPKPKTPRGITRAAFAMALFFFLRSASGRTRYTSTEIILLE